MSEIIKFHYAYQLCDIASREGKPRICGDDRTLLSKKSFMSFIISIKHLIEYIPNSHHTICVFNDRSTDELVSWIYKKIEEHRSEKLDIIFQNTEEPGIHYSIKQCYIWLQENGYDFVYQVQDDYLFFETALLEMYKVIHQVKMETGYDIVASPFNDFWLWLAVYRNAATPRTVIVGEKRYWIQYYDMSCSFMTIHQEFRKHWELYNQFFDLLKMGEKNLENYSLNFMLTRKGVLGLVPVNSLAFHMQSELEKDPHFDWKILWDSINV